MRVLGPYRHEGAWRCRIVTSAGRSWAPTAATETEALQGAEKQAATLARQGSITIRDSIEAYVRSKQVADARPSTLDGTRRALIVYFTGILDWPVGRLTPRRAQECYDALQVVGRPARPHPGGRDASVLRADGAVLGALGRGQGVDARPESGGRGQGGRTEEARQAAAILR